MAQTPTKLPYPTGQDPFQPHRDIKKLAEAATVIVPVENRAEADDIANILNPSTDQPLYVDRSDTGTLERNSGNGWEPCIFGDTGLVNVSIESGWDGGSIQFQMRQGRVTALVYVLRGAVLSGDWRNLCYIPAAMRPAVNIEGAATFSAEGGTVCMIRATPAGRLQTHFTSVVNSPSHILRGTLTWEAA